MIHWCDSTYIEKIKYWRDLREEIKGLEVQEATEKVAKFWARVPYANSKLNLFDATDWPTPWNILDTNNICCNMISLMIYHTFKLARPDLQTEIKVVFENDHNFLVVMVENFILNYHIGFPLNKDEQYLMFVHTYTDI